MFYAYMSILITNLKSSGVITWGYEILFVKGLHFEKVGNDSLNGFQIE